MKFFLSSQKLGITHWSYTQASYIDAAWVFRYLVLTQEQRRLIPGNSQMTAGVLSGEAVQKHYADTIYKLGIHKN